GVPTTRSHQAARQRIRHTSSKSKRGSRSKIFAGSPRPRLHRKFDLARPSGEKAASTLAWSKPRHRTAVEAERARRRDEKADIAERPSLTHLRHQRAIFAVMHSDVPAQRYGNVRASGGYP